MAKLLSEMLPVVEHTVGIYLFLMVALRLAGRHQMGQLTVVDFIILILLGSAVETAMVNGDTSLLAGLVCSATLLLLNRLFAFLVARVPHLNKAINGDPITLVNNGHFVEENLRRLGLTHDDVLLAIRARGLADETQARFAIMEPDGQITVIPMRAKVHKSKRSSQTQPSS